jgi:hypothetical protein
MGIAADDVVYVCAVEEVEECSIQSFHLQSLPAKRQANTQYPNLLVSE